MRHISSQARDATLEVVMFKKFVSITLSLQGLAIACYAVYFANKFSSFAFVPAALLGGCMFSTFAVTAIMEK